MGWVKPLLFSMSKTCSVEIRIYKRYDIDLFALAEAGYPLANMFKDSLIAYANGTPLHYYIDENITFSLNDKKSFRTRFIVPKTEEKAQYLLSKIKHGWRNSFCKMVLRNALIQQSLGCYFSDSNLIALQNMNLIGKNINSFQNVIPCSKIKEMRYLNYNGQKIAMNTGMVVNVSQNPYLNFQPSFSAIGQQAVISQISQPKIEYLDTVPVNKVDKVEIKTEAKILDSNKPKQQDTFKNTDNLDISLNTNDEIIKENSEAENIDNFLDAFNAL